MAVFDGQGKSLILQRFLDEGIEFTPLEHRIVIVKIVVTV